MKITLVFEDGDTDEFEVDKVVFQGRALIAANTAFEFVVMEPTKEGS